LQHRYASMLGTKAYNSCGRRHMNNKEKRARFRELAKQERIRTATELAEELAQPLLPFNEFRPKTRSSMLRYLAPVPHKNSTNDK
jgi:hypothetical protein